MQRAFEKINAIPGVLGSFVVGAGRLEASSLPAFFSADSLATVGEPMLKALASARELAVEVGEITLDFGDTRVVVSPLESDRLLYVVCQEDADPARLADTIGALEPRDLSEPAAPPPVAVKAAPDVDLSWFFGDLVLNASPAGNGTGRGAADGRSSGMAGSFSSAGTSTGSQGSGESSAQPTPSRSQPVPSRSQPAPPLAQPLRSSAQPSPSAAQPAHASARPALSSASGRSASPAPVPPPPPTGEPSWAFVDTPLSESTTSQPNSAITAATSPAARPGAAQGESVQAGTVQSGSASAGASPSPGNPAMSLQAGQPEARATAPGASDPAAPPPPPAPLTPAQRTQIQAELARVIGPVATLLVNEVVRPGMTPAVAIKLLAREIDSEEDRSNFLVAVAGLSV